MAVADSNAPAQPLPTTIELSTSSVTTVDGKVVAVGFSKADEDSEYVLGLKAEQALEELSVDPFALLDRAQASGSAGEVVSL